MGTGFIKFSTRGGRVCELCLGLLWSDSLLACLMPDMAAPDEVVDACMLPMLHHFVF